MAPRGHTGPGLQPSPKTRRWRAGRIIAGLLIIVPVLTSFLFWMAGKPGGEAAYVFDTLTLIGLIVGTCIAYEQLTLANRQLLLLVRQQQEERLRLRREGAISYSLNRHRSVLAAQQLLDRQFGPGEFGQDNPVQTERIASDARVKDALQLLLAHWENLALTVATGTTDEDMAFEMTGQLLVNYCDRYRPFIADTPANPRAYAYLKMLCDRWRGRLASGPGPLFPLPDTPEAQPAPRDRLP